MDHSAGAMDAGADVCVVSVHKMGTGFEQGSVFHRQADLGAAGRLAGRRGARCDVPSGEWSRDERARLPRRARVLCQDAGADLHRVLAVACEPVPARDPVVYLADFACQVLVPLAAGSATAHPSRALPIAGAGIGAEAPVSPDGSDDFRTTWVIDLDGNRIEVVQWPGGHADGITAADWAE